MENFNANEVRTFLEQQFSESPAESKVSHIVRQIKKEERKKGIVKAYSCKKAVYEGCKMLAPDGFCLSNCDRKKAEWYVNKGLADVIPHESAYVI